MGGVPKALREAQLRCLRNQPKEAEMSDVENPVITITLQPLSENMLAMSAGRTPLNEIEIDIWAEGMTKEESLLGSQHTLVSEVIEALKLRQMLPQVLEALATSLSALKGRSSPQDAIDEAQQVFDRLRELIPPA